ncbi:MAG: RluA family pseudouridine synthase [Clostridiales bacterium]|nr:RluA family pseudouridine synthase [Clostridiales bacterium]
MNLYTFVVPPEIGDVRLYALARRMLPELPEYAIKEAFAQKDVKMNGVRVSKDAIALPGAGVALYSRYGGERLEVPILFEDDHVLVVRKPIGVSCQADAKGGKTIVELVWSALQNVNPNASEPLLCHRLDNQTDGLLLLAKDEETQGFMMDAFKRRQIHKTYICLVKGAPAQEHAVLEAYLVKDAAKGKVRVQADARCGGLPIKTEYRVLERGPISRLEVTLHTGRTHQIRAQLNAIGHPIVGDDQYGDRTLNKAYKAKGLMLCATKLTFSLTGPMDYLNECSFQIEPQF